VRISVVTLLQPFALKGKANVFFDEPQQVGVRNLIFQTEVVEQRLRPIVLPHVERTSSLGGTFTRCSPALFHGALFQELSNDKN
jgi:hypothetical protein